MRNAWALTALMTTLALAGCLADDGAGDDADGTTATDEAPFLGYVPSDPDMDLPLLMEDLFLPGTDGVTLHARITRPVGDGPFPAIVQHTPYTAPGCNTAFYGSGAEPPVGACGEGTFEREFARRGYAYVHADLRGTGDSDGCLDLRGQADIADIGALADGLAEQPWSNGNVGFIGASYPGSTSHMAALSGSEAVKAVVPIVASTSFYHYHHNDGVPYFANHLATNAGYTQQGLTPTFNPLSAIQKLADQPLCPHVENAVVHGAADQTGSYYDWWQERNLRPLAETVTTPVLMAQGLADWNVKPDHVATWFNDIPSENKVFIGGQWGHAYPASDDGACPADANATFCSVPWGSWWAYATAFFDTYLKEIDTGMFEGSVAWVQDNNGTWHRSIDWPLPPEDRDAFTLHIHPDGTLSAAPHPADKPARLDWAACPDYVAAGATEMDGAPLASTCTMQDGPEELVFESVPFAEDTLLSGVGYVNLSVQSSVDFTHLIVVIDQLDEDGDVVVSRENYGYLNPTFRNGLESPEPVPVGETYTASIDLYPQEDLVPAGHSLRLTVRSNDGGAIATYDEGTNTLVWDETHANTVWFPTRPADLQGVRLPSSEDGGTATAA